MDEDGKFMGKSAKCKGRAVREACHALHLLTTDTGPADMFGPYTQVGGAGMELLLLYYYILFRPTRAAPAGLT